MNKAKLKTYAPQARKDFIAAVTARAHRLGLPDRRKMMQEWADYLDNLNAGAQVIPFRKSS